MSNTIDSIIKRATWQTNEITRRTFIMLGISFEESSERFEVRSIKGSYDQRITQYWLDGEIMFMEQRIEYKNNKIDIQYTVLKGVKIDDLL